MSVLFGISQLNLGQQGEKLGHAAGVTGTWRYMRAVDGWGVSGIMHTEIEGMDAFEESELIGFDAAEGKIHLFSMNQYAIRDHTADWIDENRLLVRYTGMEEGKEVTEAITIDFVTPDRMVGHVIEHADGEVVMTTDLTLERQG